MKILLPYRILSFILLPVAAFIGIITIFMLIVALANPPILLVVFLFASVAIYVIASFIFLQKGIDQKQLCKHSLKDWIKVNAIVSTIFCLLFLLQSVALLSDTKLLNEALQQAITQQQTMMVMPEATYLKILKGVLYFFLIFSSLLLVHIVLTFRIIKTYGKMFMPK